MALIEKIDANYFFERLENSALRKGTFTFEACEAIVEFFEETDCEQDTEFDLIGLCCEFSEFESCTDWRQQCYRDTDEIKEDIKDEEPDATEDELEELLEERCRELLNDKVCWFKVLKYGTVLVLND